jgi:AhpD family alkylhydroperoxidase
MGGLVMSKLINKGIVRAASFMNLKNRINYFKVAPEALEKIMELEKYVKKTAIDKGLRELIKIRVSQINGCSYCLDMHTKDARKLKVSEEKIDNLRNWKESDIFNDKEKIAFELAENITLVSEKGVSDELYLQVREHFDEKDYVDLVMIINQINMWNRLSISMGNSANN